MAIFLLPTGNSRLIFGAPMVLINASTGSYAILPTFISTDIWYYYKHSNQGVSYTTQTWSILQGSAIERIATILRPAPGACCCDAPRQCCAWSQCCGAPTLLLRAPSLPPILTPNPKPPVLRYPLRHPYLPAISRDPSVSIVGARQPTLRCHGRHR